MASEGTPPPINLHPIATDASTYFVQGGNAFSKEALAKLAAALEAIAEKEELGPAVASLVQVAQYLDKTLNAKAASAALMDLAVAQTFALEKLNKKAQEKKQDADRAKAKAFNKFSGKK
jgi:hypothetical protein